MCFSRREFHVCVRTHTRTERNGTNRGRWKSRTKPQRTRKRSHDRCARRIDGVWLSAVRPLDRRRRRCRVEAEDEPKLCVLLRPRGWRKIWLARSSSVECLQRTTTTTTTTTAAAAKVPTNDVRVHTPLIRVLSHFCRDESLRLSRVDCCTRHFNLLPD